jgi:hypothetical protein
MEAGSKKHQQHTFVRSYAARDDSSEPITYSSLFVGMEAIRIQSSVIKTVTKHVEVQRQHQPTSGLAETS